MVCREVALVDGAVEALAQVVGEGEGEGEG